METSPASPFFLLSVALQARARALGRPDHREERGMELAQQNNVTRINAKSYRVKSQTGNEVYNVFKDEEEWRCACPD
jgi:hypothetical protein